MAVANFDSSQKASSAAGVSSLTSANWTVGSGASNTCLWHGIGSGSGTPVACSGSKWQGSGGTALSQVGTTNSIGSFWKHSLWRLIAPTGATNTSYASWGSAQDEVFMTCMSSKDTDQTTPNGTVSTSTGTSSPITTNVSTTTGELCFDFVFLGNDAADSPTITVGANQTSKQEIESGSPSPYEAMGCSVSTAASSTETMDWTFASATSPHWSTYAFQVNGISGGGGGDPAATGFKSLLGVGVK